MNIFFNDFTGKQFCSRKNYLPPFPYGCYMYVLEPTQLFLITSPMFQTCSLCHRDSIQIPQPNKQPCLSKFLSYEITSCTVGSTLMARFLTPASSSSKEFFVEKVNFFDKWQELIASQRSVLWLQFWKKISKEGRS